MCSFFCCFSALVFVLVLAGVLRVYWVITKKNGTPSKRKTPVKLMVVAGSGGHTSEILRLVSSLSAHYKPCVYIVAETDKMSEDKITDLEGERSRRRGSDFQVIQIPRSREVRQSWVTTVLTTARATLLSFPLAFSQKPDLVLTNGPGTCVPICLAAFTMKVLGYHDPTIVYVESVCRVKTLSLSGKILYLFADHFLVQWKQLTVRYPQAVYLGRLV